MILLAPIAVTLFGLALRMVLGMVYGVRGPAPDDVFYTLWWFVSWTFILLGMLAWCLLPLAGSLGSLVICLLLWILAGFAVVDSVTSSRDANRRTNAKLLAIAQGTGRLKEANQLFEAVQQGWAVGSPARGVGYDLQSGTPLYESIRNHPRALPRTAPAYAAVGTLANAEPQALDELSRPVDPGLASAARSWFDYMAYLVAMMLTMGFLLSLYGVFVLPQFGMIFDEFGVQLPAMTRALGTGYGSAPLWGLMAFAAAIAILCLGFVAVLYLFDVRVLQSAGDLLFRRAHIATVLRMVALGVEHRVELPRLLYALSVTYPVRSLRDRLSGAYADAHAGQPLPAALTGNRLLSPNEQGLIETAERVGNVPWALRQIAVRRESLLATRMNVLVRLAYPVIVLSIALFVAFIVIALFIPLVKLVEGLS